MSRYKTVFDGLPAVTTLWKTPWSRSRLSG